MARVLTLVRGKPTPDGTFGTMSVPFLPFLLYTCEDDWKDNAPNVSCIPEGEYTLRRTVYHKHGYETFEVMGIPGRSRILIHPGNTEEDTAGCILIGMRRGTLHVAKDEDTGATNVEKRAVVESQEAFRRFMRAMQGTDHATLRIIESNGVELN